MVLSRSVTIVRLLSLDILVLDTVRSFYLSLPCLSTLWQRASLHLGRPLMKLQTVRLMLVIAALQPMQGTAAGLLTAFPSLWFMI